MPEARASYFTNHFFWRRILRCKQVQNVRVLFDRTPNQNFPTTLRLCPRWWLLRAQLRRLTKQTCQSYPFKPVFSTATYSNSSRNHINIRDKMAPSDTPATLRAHVTGTPFYCTLSDNCVFLWTGENHLKTLRVNAIKEKNRFQTKTGTRVRGFNLWLT